MYVQSFIFTITSSVTMVLFIYNTFFKTNINHYKIKSDNQRKYLNIHNVIKFRNILFDYCNSLDLSDLKYEIEKNDFQYINKLLQIKNQIDINYNNNIKYYNKLDDDKSEYSEYSDDSNKSDSLESSDTSDVINETDVIDDTDTTDTTEINKINDKDNDNNNISNNNDNNNISYNTEFENIRKELTKLLQK